VLGADEPTAPPITKEREADGFALGWGATVMGGPNRISWDPA
jgi:hypothetical protein